MHDKLVSELLGHSTITLTLDTYSHVIPAMDGDAAAAMDVVFTAKQRVCTTALLRSSSAAAVSEATQPVEKAHGEVRIATDLRSTARLEQVVGVK